MNKKMCRECREFFSKFRCAASTHMECDCPKCQGYCTCNVDSEGHFEPKNVCAKCGAQWDAPREDGSCYECGEPNVYTRIDAGTGREHPLSDDDWPKN